MKYYKNEKKTNEIYLKKKYKAHKNIKQNKESETDTYKLERAKDQPRNT